LTRPHRFAIASFDELWSIDRDHLLERRVVHGVLEDDGERIDAHDAADEELVGRAEAQLKRCRSVILSVAKDPSLSSQLRMTLRARLHTEARRVVASVVESATIVLNIGGMSVVTTPEHVAADGEWLERVAARQPEDSLDDYRGLPLLWTSGSASVLLHEAAGHAAEHGQAPIAWPGWLAVRDEPSVIDDIGDLAPPTDLLTEAPRAMRRESFVHPVLPRMSHVNVRQQRAPFHLPDRHVAIHLVAGGHYEPLTETVSIFVAAADLVDGGKSTPLQPFVIREARADVARSLAGARGEPVRYPGVICSREGQELVVGSAAPEMVTVF
jgi:hypothetical protein